MSLALPNGLLRPRGSFPLKSRQTAGQVGRLDLMPSSDLGERLHRAPHLRGPPPALLPWHHPPGREACAAKEPCHRRLWLRCLAPRNCPPKWPRAHFPIPECVQGASFLVHAPELGLGTCAGTRAQGAAAGEGCACVREASRGAGWVPGREGGAKAGSPHTCTSR